MSFLVVCRRIPLDLLLMSCYCVVTSVLSMHLVHDRLFCWCLLNTGSGAAVFALGAIVLLQIAIAWCYFSLNTRCAAISARCTIARRWQNAFTDCSQVLLL